MEGRLDALRSWSLSYLKLSELRALVCPFTLVLLCATLRTKSFRLSFAQMQTSMFAPRPLSIIPSMTAHALGISALLIVLFAFGGLADEEAFLPQRTILCHRLHLILHSGYCAGTAQLYH
jgi:hypothetical protein